MRDMIKRTSQWIAILCLCVSLGGCLTDGIGMMPVTTLTPICSALVGPLKYNTFKKLSLRYAGRVLAVDLHQRNEIGQRLGCPQFR